MGLIRQEWLYYDLLLNASRNGVGTDNTPIPSNLFTPIELSQWLDSTNTKYEDIDTPPFSLYFDLDEFSPEEIAEAIGNLSVLYASIGGDELIIEDTTIMDPSAVLVPAGGDDEGGMR
jgi:hypothetical protein